MISAKDPKGNISYSEYYPSRRLKKTTAPSPFSYQTSYEYNANGWLLHVKQNTSVGLVYHQSITYTAAGQKATVKGPYKSGQDLGINLTTYTYDALGRTWKVKDAENNTTETRYYPDGRVWKVIDAEGHDVVTNTYNADGSLQKVVDAKGNATQYEYNGFMGLTKTIYEDGTYTQSAYDGLRRMDWLRTRAGDVIAMQFDNIHRVKTKTLPGNTINYSYDISSRLVSVTDGAGTISNTYDDLGRLTQTNDAHSQVIAYEYDAAGLRSKLTYPDSSYISYEYDQLNRLTKIKDASQAVLSQYSYDDRSRCTNVAFANSTSLQCQYDMANRLLSIDNSTGNDSHDYDYTYDKVGNRLSMTVNSTEQHSYTYDDIYQITNVDYPAGYAYLSEDTQFNYDDAGNRSAVIESGSPGHTAPYVTNALNQYKSVDNVWYDYDENGNITHDSEFNYSYDPENRLIGITHSAGGTDEIGAAVETDLSFTFGGDANWVSTTAESYYQNSSARSGTISNSQTSTIETTVQGAGTISFYWKISSQSSSGDDLRFLVDDSIKLNVDGDQSWTVFTYNVTGMGSHTLKWMYRKDSSGSAGDDCAWIDKVVWTPKTATWYTAPRANSSSTIWMMASTYGSPVTQYYFECLTAGAHDSGWQSSTYYMDSSLSPGQTYRYRVKGRDSSQNETGWSEVKSATTTGTIGTPAEQYAPDDWANISYTYDASGRRITKDVDCILTKYIYDGDHVIAEYGTDGELLRKFIYGPGTDNPVCMIEVADNNAKYYYHRDGLGNVIALSDDAGDTVQTYEYTIFGQVAASDPNHTNPYMFTGRRFDSETGLYYYRARIYNPYIGRFLQTDPIGYSDGINWYAYCGNNPGNFVDPSGLRRHPSDDLEYSVSFTCPTVAMFDPSNIPGVTTDEWAVDVVTGWLENHNFDNEHPYWTVTNASVNKVSISFTVEIPSASLELYGHNMTPEDKAKPVFGLQTMESGGANTEWTAINQVIIIDGIGRLDWRTFNRIIRPDIERINQTYPKGGGAGVFYRRLVLGCDSAFHKDGVVGKWRWGRMDSLYGKSELNYILEGHAMRHIGYSSSQARGFVECWKRTACRHPIAGPTSGTLKWFYMGYYGYDGYREFWGTDNEN